MRKISAILYLLGFSMIAEGLGCCQLPAPDPVPTYCWECSTRIIVKTSPSSASVYESVRDICNLTTQQARDLELAGTTDSPSAYVEIKCSLK